MFTVIPPTSQAQDAGLNFGDVADNGAMRTDRGARAGRTIDSSRTHSYEALIEGLAA